MTVTFAVCLVAAVVAVLAFVASAVRSLPVVIDTVDHKMVLVRWLARRHRLRRFLRQRLDRGTAGGLALTLAVLTALVVALVVALLVDMVDSSSGLAGLDEKIARWDVANGSSAAIGPARMITHLGDTVVVVTVLLATGLVDFARRRRAESVAFLGIAIAGEQLLVNGLKDLVDRARPDLLQLAGWEGPSFPSGHTAAAAVAWPAVALVAGRGCSRAVRSLLAGAAVLVAVAVAATRVLLGVHWLTDVAAGLAIGYGWFVICATVLATRVQRLDGVPPPQQNIDSEVGRQPAKPRIPGRPTPLPLSRT